MAISRSAVSKIRSLVAMLNSNECINYTFECDGVKGILVVWAVGHRGSGDGGWWRGLRLEAEMGLRVRVASGSFGSSWASKMGPFGNPCSRTFGRSKSFDWCTGQRASPTQEVPHARD